MGETIIHFYSEQEQSDPRETIRSIIGFLEPKSIRVGRSPLLDNSWARFKTNLNDEGPAPELSLAPRNTSDAIDEYRPSKWVVYDLVQCPLIMQLNEEYRIQIPEIIRGRHWPCEASLLANPHDIFEDFISEQGQYFARATFSLKIWGDSYPEDFIAYQKEVKELKTFTTIEQGLAGILGGLSCVFYMNG